MLGIPTSCQEPVGERADKEPRGQTGGRAAASEKTRRRILDTAVELFSKKGYRGATIREICSKAGVELPTLYWYFGSKSSLLATALDEVGKAWVDRMREASLVASKQPGGTLLGLGVFRAMLEEHPDLVRLPPLLTLQADDLPVEIIEALRRLRQYSVEQMAAVVEAALGRPLPDADLAANTVFGMYYGALLWQILEPDLNGDRVWADYDRTIRLIITDRLLRGE